MKEKESVFKKYKWLYLWVVGCALAVLSVVMLVNSEFGNSIVFYLFGALLVGFTIIRFVPLLKTTRQRFAIAINAIEMFADFVVGILMIILTATIDDKNTLYIFFPFLLGVVLYARGVIYLVETCFFNTKVEKVKFFISILLITVASVIIGRYNDFSVNSMRYLLLLIFAICSLISIVNGITNYNNYRKLYVKVEKKIEKNETINTKVELPSIESEIIIDENNTNNQQNYVS